MLIDQLGLLWMIGVGSTLLFSYSSGTCGLTRACSSHGGGRGERRVNRNTRAWLQNEYLVTSTHIPLAKDYYQWGWEIFSTSNVTWPFESHDNVYGFREGERMGTIELPLEFGTFLLNPEKIQYLPGRTCLLRLIDRRKNWLMSLMLVWKSL